MCSYCSKSMSDKSHNLTGHAATVVACTAECKALQHLNLKIAIGLSELLYGQRHRFCEEGRNLRQRSAAGCYKLTFVVLLTALSQRRSPKLNFEIPLPGLKRSCGGTILGAQGTCNSAQDSERFPLNDHSSKHLSSLYN
jgi:hypothetical protein